MEGNIENVHRANAPPEVQPWQWIRYKFLDGPLRCNLCHSEIEDHDHLFFKCSYSSYLWQRCKLKLGLRPRRQCTLSSEIAEFSRLFKEDNQVSELAKLTLNVAIWYLWHE